MSIKKYADSEFFGCNFVIDVDELPMRLLQITDMQFIDALQRRTPDRLGIDEINAWHPDNLDAVCANQIRSLIAQSNPHFIFITGDIIFGSFDDNGTVWDWFCSFMDSFRIPWAPVFGNHDNESAKGVAWQCERLVKSKYCVFDRGTVSGNGNYTVGFRKDNRLIRVLHMLDSNGCAASADPEVIKSAVIFADQTQQLIKNTHLIEQHQNKSVPAFIAMHIPTVEFAEAETAKGYKIEGRHKYVLGVDVPAQDGDFGCKYENYNCARSEQRFMDVVKQCNVQAVFAGHCHNINTCIEYEGIKWVFGLKTGQYDYHVVGQLGGTLVTLNKENFYIHHLPALVPCAPYPQREGMFENLFAERNVILK